MRTGLAKIATFAAAIKLAAGCGGAAIPRPLVPFSARPDTTVPGDLRGPFDGQVLDGDSGKPIEGAAVLASWAYEAGDGLHGPAAATARLVETDADGRYEIPVLSDLSDRRMRLDRFTLVVYKRGFVAWRSDRRFEDLSARHDFAQRGNVAKLSRLPSDVSHAKHLRFIGAGGPLLGKLGWELQQAALEAEPGRKLAEAKAEAKAETTAEQEKAAEKPVAPAKPAEATLDASPLLSADELKAVTGFKGDLTVGKLTDLASTSTYDSIHFRAEGRPETWDAAIRLYEPGEAAAAEQFDKLLKDLPGAVEKDEVGDRSLRAREKNIYAVATLDRAHGAVILFTCGADQCGDFDTVLGITRRMVARLGRVRRP